MIVVLAGWEVIESRVAQYYAAFLILSGLMIGVFAAADGLLFYVFFEATLIPMYIIIGIWGGSNRVYAALKFFLYTLAGSLLMLVALVYLYTVSGGQFGILDWHQAKIGMTPQILLFLAFLAAFAVKVPMWPVHTWLPDAHVEAPTGGSIVLAAIMLKLGAYGFLRFSLPIVPDASHQLAGFIIALSLIAVVYIGLVALVQADMKKLVAYSSIAHMGFVTLGFFIFEPVGMAGGIVQMISHGFVSGAMFFCIGVMYDRMHSRQIADYGGVVNTMPKFAAFFMLFAMANAGLPATSGFVGEFMVILGAVKYDFWIAAAAATTLVLGAAYSLWMYKRVVFGEVANEHVAALTDVNAREFLILLLLAAAVLWMGVYPKPVTDLMDASVQAPDRARAAEQAARRDGRAVGPVGRPTMANMNLFAALPEIVLLVAACAILVADLFVPDERRNVTYGLSMAALVAVAAVLWLFLDNRRADLRLQRHVRRGPDDERAEALLGARRRLHAGLRAGLRARPRHVEGRALHADAVRAARDHADDLGEQPAGDLPRAGAAGAVAVRAGGAAAGRRALERGRDEVLRAGRARVGLPAVRHVDAVRRQRHARHQRAGAARRDRAGGQPPVARARRRLRDRRPRVQARRGAVPHVGARRLPGRADARDAADRLRAEARRSSPSAYRILVEGLLPLAVDWQKMLIVLAVASLVLGNLTAIAQTNLKRMLAYSTIAQMGFMLLAMLSGVTKGDAAATATAYSAAMFYVITYALTTLGTFGVILLLAREGFEAEEIADLKGLNRRSPWYAFVMLLLMFSLAGIPPTVGFYAKFVVLQALLVDGVTSAWSGWPCWRSCSRWSAPSTTCASSRRCTSTSRRVAVATAPIVATTDMRVALSINGALVLVLGILPQYLLKLCADAVQRALGG